MARCRLENVVLLVRACVLALLITLLAAAAEASQVIAPLPFTTDGCSRFPDRSGLTDEDWCDCCVQHDLSYWRGGSAEQRQQADQALRDCVRHKTGDAPLAELMYAGVRTGGGPYYLTSYRWGYGWPYGRGYAPLSAPERDALASEEQRYRAVHPQLVCPSH